MSQTSVVSNSQLVQSSSNKDIQPHSSLQRSSSSSSLSYSSHPSVTHLSSPTSITPTINNNNYNNNNNDASGTPNRKRSRATAEQLAVLEDIFATNVSPNSKLRKQLAEQLKMTERSIQIWFQNRRAKVKHMQKKAQMQMHQAALRAQLYHINQQREEYMNVCCDALYSWQQHQQQQKEDYCSTAAAAISSSYASFLLEKQQHQQQAASRAASVNPSLFGGGGGWSAPPEDIVPSASRASMPPQPTCSSITDATSSLVPIPEAGPTALLATSCAASSTSSSSSSPAHVASNSSSSSNSDVTTPSPLNLADFYVDPLLLSPYSTAALSSMVPASINCFDATVSSGGSVGAGAVTTTLNHPSIFSSCSMDDAASLPLLSSSITPAGGGAFAPAAPAPCPLQEIIISATTLSIGSWQRLAMNADLVCAYDPIQKAFVWHIINDGLHFKIFIPVGTVSAITYAEQDPALASIRFDLNETPQCFIKEDHRWKPCSDFSEGKQVSRYFSHCIKGVAYQLKQDLFMLTTLCEETQRLVFMPSSSGLAATTTTDTTCLVISSSTDSLGVTSWMQQQVEEAHKLVATQTNFV